MIVYKGRLLKKSSNQKSKLILSTLVTTWLSSSAFHLRPTLVAIDSESRRAFVLARPTRASRARELPQELGSWFCPLKSLNLWLQSGTAFREIARRQAGAQTWTQTWTQPSDQRVAKVLQPSKSQHKLCGVWILFRSVTGTKLEPSEVTFRRLMPHCPAAALVFLHPLNLLPQNYQ